MMKMLIAVGVLVVVVGSISWTFFGALQSGISHTDAQAAALGYGYASALCWGLSIVGLLIWRGLLPAWLGMVTTSTFWNGWFNLFAAIGAAAAVAFASI